MCLCGVRRACKVGVYRSSRPPAATSGSYRFSSGCRHNGRGLIALSCFVFRFDIFKFKFFDILLRWKFARIYSKKPIRVFEMEIKLITENKWKKFSHRAAETEINYEKEYKIISFNNNVSLVSFIITVEINDALIMFFAWLFVPHIKHFIRSIFFTTQHPRFVERMTERHFISVTPARDRLRDKNVQCK